MYRYDDITGSPAMLQKVLLALLAAMAVLFGVLTLVFRFMPGVEWCDSLLRISREGNATLYTGTAYGKDVSIRVYPDGDDTLAEFTIAGRDPQVGRITWPEGRISTTFSGSVPRFEVYLNDRLLFSGGCNENAGIFPGFFREDGSIDTALSQGLDGYHAPDVEYFSPLASDIAAFALGPEPSYRGSWGVYFMALLLSAATAVNIAFPLALFRFRYHFSVQNPEPTDLYFSIEKGCWILLTALALVMYIWGITIIS